ncbi:MAG: 30S ribosomal protein S1 [Gammaproteobacteria bacterium]
MSKSFAELFEESLTKFQICPGEVLTGTVVQITNTHVIVNAGLKSEANIPIEQFRDSNGQLEVAVGDKVDVALKTLEDGFGETILSREEAKRFAQWHDLQKIHESGKPVMGKVTGRVKGGFTVEIGAIKGFLPGSLVDVRPVRDTSYLEGRDVEVKIIKMDQKRNNVVVSRRAVIESESHEERSALIERLQEGQVVKGVVKNLTDYGAFVDLGGVDGLLHITDMSWKRIRHPNEIVNVGDEINVKILKFDRDRNRVSLGLKQTADDPWADLKRRYPVESRHFGKVSNITDYGCFVELESGVEGLVHVSEMDWTNKNVNPNKVVKLGDEVEVVVLDIDEERRRISLGIKQCNENPWAQFAEKHAKGERIKGAIKSITDFGVFIGLEGNIDGLVHLSDISWELSGEEAVRNYAKGQEIEAVILVIDPERERISLGIKQLIETPLSKYLEQHDKGSIVKAVVTEVDDKKVVLDLGDEIVGHLKASDISRAKVENAADHYKVGDTVEAQVMGIDSKNQAITLSIKAMEKPEGQKGGQNLTSEPVVGATLGDLMKEQLGNKGDNV